MNYVEKLTRITAAEVHAMFAYVKKQNYLRQFSGARSKASTGLGITNTTVATLNQISAHPC